jgi:hypothetical protein
MEVSSLNFEMQLQMQKNKFNAKKMKYRFALACLLILLAVLMFYPTSNRYSGACNENYCNVYLVKCIMKTL